MNVARYFDRNASAFDSLYEDDAGAVGWFNHLFRRGLYERVHHTVRELETLQAPTVVDVGCGSGRNSVIFVRSGARRVIGIDFADQMLKLARDRARQHGVEDRCEFRKEDFLTSRLAGQYDASVALGVFDYIAEPVPFLKKMISLSTRKVIVSFPGVALIRAPLRKLRYALKGCPVYFYSRRSIRTLCLEAGLTDYRLLRGSSSGYMLVGNLEPHPAKAPSSPGPEGLVLEHGDSLNAQKNEPAAEDVKHGERGEV